MKTLKLVEFRAEGTGLFARYLDWLSQKNNWGWSVESHPHFSWELLQGAAAAVVSPVLSSEILSKVKIVPTQVRNIECFDSFFPEDGSWYPRILVYEALRLVLVAEARDLDIRSPAFIAGNNEDVRAVASVLADMGIVDIYLVGEDEPLLTQKSILERAHIGINFQIVETEDLTRQAISAGIIVNTLNLSERKSLLTDLSYFNFMKQSGFVLDLNLLPAHNLLLEEAAKADLRVLRPVLVAAAETRLWLERLKVGEKLSMEDLIATWEEFLKECSE